MSLSCRVFVSADAPLRESLTSHTDCGQATSLHPRFTSPLSQWCSSLATWLRAQTGKRWLGVGEKRRLIGSGFEFLLGASAPSTCCQTEICQRHLAKTCAPCVLLCLCRDLSVDAGLPPHQFHIHPLPQHYQHYLTSPRMHHFPRTNTSTQVVRPFLLLLKHSQASPSAPGDSPLGICNHRRRADCGFFSVPSTRLSMRSETTHTRSCTCWLCRVSIPPGTPPPFERAMRFLLLHYCVHPSSFPV